MLDYNCKLNLVVREYCYKTNFCHTLRVVLYIFVVVVVVVVCILARLKFEKTHFRVQDNPLIHALDEKLQATQTSSVKLLMDYLKSEDYRE